MGQTSSRRAQNDESSLYSGFFDGLEHSGCPDLEGHSFQASSSQAALTMASAAATGNAAAFRPAGQPHKSTAIIPGWSRQLSSQALTIECQKISQAQRTASAKEGLALMELEVMKFVAYCGGLTVKVRLEEAPAGVSDHIIWGLTSLKQMNHSAVSQHQQHAPHSPRQNEKQQTQQQQSGYGNGLHSGASSPQQQQAGWSEPKAKMPRGQAGLPPKPPHHGHGVPNPRAATPPALGSLSPGSGSTGCTATGLGSGLAAAPVGRLSASTSIPVDNASRKALYVVGAATLLRPPVKGDVLGICLCPRDDGQPAISLELTLNDEVVHSVLLPCSNIAALQIYPFVTVPPSASVALYEASTPSPLFTWYSPTSATADIQMADLDTCAKYHSASSSTSTGTSDFLGSTSFSTGRHRWTVQLDNMAPLPGFIFVGLVPTVKAKADKVGAATLAVTPAADLALGSADADSAMQIDGEDEATSSTLVSVSELSEAKRAATQQQGGQQASQPTKWGVWVRLPGVGTQGQNNPTAVPQAVPSVQRIDSNSTHCCITIDLDLEHGMAKYFRNGHLLGGSVLGNIGPVSPAIAFWQGSSQALQAGLVNITKLRQLDLGWNMEACSGDLCIATRAVSKVSEVFGDYSTVLATKGFTSGVHLWLVKINNLSEPDSIFIGVCRRIMPLDQDPQDLRDRTYYLSNGVIRVGGRRVATNAANFTKGDIVGVVLDADQGEIVFLRNGIEQGRARGIRGRLYPFVSFDSEGDQVTLLGSYSLNLNRTPRQLADMEWDTLSHTADIELSSNCLTATKTQHHCQSHVLGTIQYNDQSCHEFHVIMDALGPDGLWVGVAPLDTAGLRCVGDAGTGWALHSDGDKRFDGREEEFTGALSNGDVLTVRFDLEKGLVSFARNGCSLGVAFRNVFGPLVAQVTLGSEDSKVTIQNRPTVLNVGEYSGELRWDEVRAGRDLHVIDGLTITKMSNEGGDYATVLGTICLASGQHSWTIYVNHVEDSNLFIGVTVGGHDLNADPQEYKSRTYYLSNGTIRVAGKLVTRCAEPYAEGDLVTVHLDMEAKQISFHKNGVLQGAGDGLPEEAWPYVSLDNIMDSITLHSSRMFVDLAHSLKWNQERCLPCLSIDSDGQVIAFSSTEAQQTFSGQATILGLREYSRTESHSWIIRIQQDMENTAHNFIIGVAPPGMDTQRSIGDTSCGTGIDYYGYVYHNGRYFHISNLANWSSASKPVRGSTARHKGKATPLFQFQDGKCEITLTLDLKDCTLKFSSAGHSIGTLAGMKGPLVAALTMTHPSQRATLYPGPIGKNEHTAEELANILKAKGCLKSPAIEAALLLTPRDMFVPKDRNREAFRDQKITVRMMDGSTLTMPPPSFVVTALEKLNLLPGQSFLDVGSGTAYTCALATALVGPTGIVHGIECLSSRLEGARANINLLKARLPKEPLRGILREVVTNYVQALGNVELQLSNVLIPECTNGHTYDVLYCDTSISEEDLPMFLALLTPTGCMVVVIDDELLFIKRSNTDLQDYHRESLLKLTADFGELEDPTPWEIQDAIARMKHRERQRGIEMARSDLVSTRGHEYDEIQQRMAGAMARIQELEATLAQVGIGAVHNSISTMRTRTVSPGVGAQPRLLPDNHTALSDDVRSGHKDKRTSRKHRSASQIGHPKPMQLDSVSGGVQAPKWFTLQDTSGDLMCRSLRSMGDSFRIGTAIHDSIAEDPLQASSDLMAAVENLGLQCLSTEAIANLLANSRTSGVPSHGSCQLFIGSNFKGMPVRVWRLPMQPGATAREVRLLYARFCVSHPAILSILAVCLEDVLLGSAKIVTPLHRQRSGIGAAGGVVVKPLLRTTSRGADQGAGMDLDAGPTLWLVEECSSETTLGERFEEGTISWKHVLTIGRDVARAVTHVHSLYGNDFASRDCNSKRRSSCSTGGNGSSSGGGAATGQHFELCPQAAASLVLPGNVLVSPAGHAKVSLVPALIRQLEAAMPPKALLGAPQLAGSGTGGVNPPLGALSGVMAYIDPGLVFRNSSSGGGWCGALAGAVPSTSGRGHTYGLGVVLLQLLTERSPGGLVGCVEEALRGGTLCSLVPRLPHNEAGQQLAEDLARLALLCARPQSSALGVAWSCASASEVAARTSAAAAVSAAASASGCSLATSSGGAGCGADLLEVCVLPELGALLRRLEGLGSVAMSWEQMEELMLMPVVPPKLVRSVSASGRRCVRQDFRVRRRLFLEELAKLAVEAPVNRVEVRRSRCFKDSVAVFQGKGTGVWRQPLKVSFLGEAGMDSGGVTREWFTCIATALSLGAHDLLWGVGGGGGGSQLYVHPLSNTPSHLRKYAFLGLFMAKALLESAARAKELGPICLNLHLAEAFWKLLLGLPVQFMDLQALDATEFRSLTQLLAMDVEGLIFENFCWNFEAAQRGHTPQPPTPSTATATTTTTTTTTTAAKHVVTNPATRASQPRASAATSAGAASSSSSAGSADGGSAQAQERQHPSGSGALDGEVEVPSVPLPGGSPFSGADPGNNSSRAIPLKPGGGHVRVTNANKREYVLLKAQKILVGCVEAQMTALIDAFHSLIPRELLEKYRFTSLEMQLLVCGEQHVDVGELRRHCRFEEGYTSGDPQVAWFWEAVESFDEAQKRALLQFWSGSDCMPAEGFASLEPPFHVIAVDRMYDATDKTARLPAAHTCFRQLDLPRYASAQESREKLLTAITLGQGYLALS